ncbi:hypothetical protein GWI33_020174 [Rhynchophorus ferrugineus]|uniref:Uncharacterized protein n=1 Tax=Rhynchophorus ferrugineus TaxID=354439 RepID=A0A834M3M4_RHYFE|nr:hypothetical protein GWI33_020174 [Rhynchophorus ferrugineus]
MQLLQPAMAQIKSPNDKKKRNMLLIQDLNYARNLAANNEKVRGNALKYLKKYLQVRSESKNLTHENLKVLWKGLFFSIWMSDKPLIQEECAENIAHLIHSLSFNDAMEFFKIGLVTLQNEWFGIDQHRMDKFMMFVRRFLRQALVTIKKNNFKKNYNEMFALILQSTVLSTTKAPPLGLFMHFTEIYLEELAKVADGKLQTLRTIDFIKPYIEKLAFAEDQRVIDWINKFIFNYLMKQHKLGLEYEEVYKVWRSHRFSGSINQIQKVIVPVNEAQDFDIMKENSNEDKALDPRAGNVNVELPQIKFNSKDIAETLLLFKTNPKTTKHTRHFLTQWAERFQKLYQGTYPLGIKKIENGKKDKLKDYDTNVTKAAKRLIKFEQNLLENDRKTNKRKLDDLANTDVPDSKKIKVSFESKLLKTQIKELEENFNKMEAVELNDLKTKINLIINKEKSRTNYSRFEYCFKRNSGLWIVTLKENDENFTDSNNFKNSTEINRYTSEWKQVQETKSKAEQAPVKYKAEPEAAKKEELVLPYKKTIKQSGKERNKTKAEDNVCKLKGKNKAPENVISSSLKSGSPKRVKINTKLNVSQEVDDHIRQVIASPSIPFDSTKKPGKPLLKAPVKSSPINPFYKRKLFQHSVL